MATNLPLLHLGREIRVASLLEFFKSRDVWSIGRFGGWRYSSIDDAIVEALQAVRECVPNASSTFLEAPLKVASRHENE